ncbi:MAG: GntR family transcriptional regulator [Clostridia bacterium]|nr:GntR family transcriptional regulator [Clostridia bacterium]
MSNKLYVQIKEYILDIIKRNDGKNQILLPSEAQLCKKFNASRYSVRHALKLLEAKKQIVRIQGKGTFINLDNDKFQSLSDNRCIDIIVPFLMSSHSNEIILGAQKFCSENNYYLNIKNSNDSQAQENYHLRTIHYNSQGVILFPLDTSNMSKEVINVSTSNFPCVLVDKYISNLDLYCVQTDNFKMLYNAVKQLNLQGYKSPCYLTLADNLIVSMTERNNGFYLGMLNCYGKIEKHNLIMCKAYSDDFTDVLTNYLKNGLIDCIIMNDGPFTLKFVNLCNKLGIQIGKDIKIILIDEETSMSALNIPCGRIKQQSFEIGYSAAEMLHKIITGKKPKIKTVKIPAINDF